MESFSSSAQVVMERRIEFEKEPVPTDPELIEDVYEIKKCVEWIKQNNFKKVCLQFPDTLLIDSVEISILLEKLTTAQIFILGDTSYGSCCVDEIASHHVHADSIIHFGHACLTLTERLPVLYIFEKFSIDIAHFITSFQNQFKKSEEKLLLLYDVGYTHSLDDITNKLNLHYKNLVISQLCTKKEDINDDYAYSFGRKYPLEKDDNLKNFKIIFIGTDSRTFNNFLLNYLDELVFFIYDPTNKSPELKLFEASQSRFLMRRLYLIEKIRDSETIGILAGTLGAHRYLDCVKRLKELCKLKKKKSYIIAVGKPNVPKLANFPEIEIFVHVSCPENAIYDSKEYLRPIVTPYDFELACQKSTESTNSIINKYITDFRNLLPGGSDYKEIIQDNDSEEADISLITGEIRQLPNSTSKGNLSVALKPDGTLATIVNSSGSQYLSQRSWVGLNNTSTNNEINLAVKGRSGIAYGYNNESEILELNCKNNLPAT